LPIIHGEAQTVQHQAYAWHVFALGVVTFEPSDFPL
jgi:hypothetical protein